MVTGFSMSEIRLLPCQPVQLIAIVDSPYMTHSSAEVEIAFHERLGGRKFRKRFAIGNIRETKILTTVFHAGFSEHSEDFNQPLGMLIVSSNGNLVGEEKLPCFGLTSSADGAVQVLGLHVSILLQGISVRCLRMA